MRVPLFLESISQFSGTSTQKNLKLNLGDDINHPDIQHNIFYP